MINENYIFKKEDLDKRICDVITIANNTQTFREFIKESEKELSIGHKNLDNMSNKNLCSNLEILIEKVTLNKFLGLNLKSLSIKEKHLSNKDDNSEINLLLKG